MSARTPTHPTRPTFSARHGLTSRTAVTTAMAGGVLAGGILVALATLTGRLSGHALLLTSTGLFLVGALAGFAFGALLAMAAPDEGRTPEAVEMARAAVASVLGLAVSWLVAVWVAMTLVAGFLGRPFPTVLVAVAWVAAVLILVRGVRDAAEALVTAIRRIREEGVGSAAPRASHR